MARSKNGLGTLLRQRRTQLKLTQLDVAKKVGCRANYVGYLESGERHPSQRILAKLAKVLDLDFQELFLLANPKLRDLFAVPNATVDASAWEQFQKNTRLHTRHCITAAEIAALEGVATLGAIRTERDFLFILQTFRQALISE